MTVQPFLAQKRLLRFNALQSVLLPFSTKFDVDQKARGIDLVNTLVGSMPAANQKKLALFLVVIDLLSFIVGFGSFRSLGSAKQEKLLHWLFDCPIPLLRKGFWGVNSVVKLSVYGQSSVYSTIGYQIREIPNE